MNNQRHVHLIITGRVQGVWFRASTREAADNLGIKGWVKNLPDLSVEVDAAGEPADVEQFIQWCSKGPPGARVTAIDIKELEPVNGLQGFKILR
ncbi:MAG: acylphosphatase [Deltaproteobacteria bacterium]|nr:acylphosphatase [Deltaproteobacteria bacterium]MCL5878867.1 acylphosphatase [Deltaproteobacteria bacterium]